MSTYTVPCIDDGIILCACTILFEGQMEITERGNGNGNVKWKRSSGEKPPSEYTHHSH